MTIPSVGPSWRAKGHRLEKGQDAFSKQQLPDWLRRELPKFVTRDEDAALFDDLLGERADSAATTRETATATHERQSESAP